VPVPANACRGERAAVALVAMLRFTADVRAEEADAKIVFVQRVATMKPVSVTTEARHRHLVARKRGGYAGDLCTVAHFKQR